MDFLTDDILLFKAILYMAKKVYVGMEKDRVAEGYGKI